MVQNNIGTRSSSQARSHAQKFFQKLRNSNFLNVSFGIDKNSIMSLYNYAQSLDKKDLNLTIKKLNTIGFERCPLNNIERTSKLLIDKDELLLINDSNSNINLSSNTFEFSSNYNENKEKDEFSFSYIEEKLFNNGFAKNKDYKLAKIEDNCQDNSEYIPQLIHRKRIRSSHFIDLECFNYPKDELNNGDLLSFQSCFNHFFSNQDRNYYSDISDDEFENLLTLTREHSLEELHKYEPNNKDDLNNKSQIEQEKRKEKKKLFETKIFLNNNCQFKRKIKFVTQLVQKIS